MNESKKAILERVLEMLEGDFTVLSVQKERVLARLNMVDGLLADKLQEIEIIKGEIENAER